MRLTKRKAILVAGASGLLAAGIAVPSVALAAHDPTPSPSTSSSAPANPGDAKTDRRAQHKEELAAALAKELGIDKDKVSAALDKVLAEQQANRPSREGMHRQGENLKTRLDKAVSEGKLTQAEADAITKAVDAGILGPGGGPHRFAGKPDNAGK